MYRIAKNMEDLAQGQKIPIAVVSARDTFKFAKLPMLS